MVSRRYLFTNIARNDLNDILDYIHNTLLNPSAAQKLYSRLMEIIDGICLFPERYPIVENDFISRKDIRKVSINNYLMYYSFDAQSNIILIVRIIYGKRDVDQILKIL